MENSSPATVFSMGPEVRLDTRVVHKNGGGCGRQQEITNMQLFDGGCSDILSAPLAYSCEAPCGADAAYPSVEVMSAGEGNYNFYLTFRNITADETRNFCCVLNIVTPQFQSQSILKEFTVTYSGLLLKSI